MFRRLYLLFPDPIQAQTAVSDLKQWGIAETHIHAVAHSDVDLEQLPPATQRQRGDTIWKIERLAWNSDLIIFAIALLLFFVALFFGAYLWAMLAFIIMLVSFVGGALYAQFAPNAHLTEFREALAHGEIALLIDLPRHQVLAVEDMIRQHYPEAIIGGIGWSIDALGI